MNNKLKVASVTANYNNGKYFGECLDGILSQTYLVDDIVIVDDGSTDNSDDLIRKAVVSAGGTWDALQPKMDNSHFWAMQRASIFSKRGRQVVWYFPQRENKGPATARNIALKWAMNRKSDVLCIADSDDILYPTKIEKSIKVMLKYPAVALVYSDYDVYNESTGEVKREFKEPFSYNRLFEECIVSNNSVIASSIFKHIDLYDESLFGPEDYDMWLRIAETAAVYHIPEALYKYRISGNNITITTPSERFAEHVRRVKIKAIERRNGKQG
jgi:glycosyltransferase involved in cell wall biosynthesis